VTDLAFMGSEGREPGDRSAIDQIVRTRLGVDAAERFLSLVRPSVGFSAGKRSSESGSVIGGVPVTTESFAWPRCRGRPMVLLAQIDCGQAARLLGGHWTLPDHGHLFFFHDDDFAAEPAPGLGDDGCRVLHVAAGTGGPPEGHAPAPPSLPALPLEACALPSVPTLADAETGCAVGDDVIALLIDLAEALSAVLPAPRHRLLGWCDSWDTPRPEGHRPLLQLEVEAGTSWGEIVNVSFWIRDEDLRAADLRGVRRSYEVA
jgi:Uncharacterized protein conserved in bacteria